MILAALALAAVLVDGEVPSGNVIVEGVTGDVVRVRQDMRDSADWFYWAFRVRGAEGRTLRFEFTDGYAGGPVSARGPAVTRDGGRTWSYAAEKTSSPKGFTYAFAIDESETWFYQTFQYFPRQWDEFLAAHEADRGRLFVADELCKSRKGRSVPRARFGCIGGKPKFRVWVSSRHHCGEATATYALEGLLSQVFAEGEIGDWLRENVEFMVVPFMDYDGVTDGDQGKGRKPHDHNRDYDTFIYPETKAAREWIRDYAHDTLDIFFDFHCPWVREGSNETLCQVYGPSETNTAAQKRWGALLEKMQSGSMGYRLKDDIPWGVSWNGPSNYTAGLSSTGWARKTLKGCRLVDTYEIPFSKANGRTVTPESCRELGRDTARVLRAFLESR